MVGVLELIAILALFAFVCYTFSTRNFDYWEKRNVPYIKPLPFVGNFLNIITLRAQIGYFLGDFYKQFNTPFFGLFVLNKPYFVVRSPDLIRSILVKDFNYFCNRTVISDEKCDSLSSKMLFMVDNPLWKALRTKTTPLFTTGKLKNMTVLHNQSAEEMVQHLEMHMSDASIELKEVCSKYATDVIVSCAFGIEAHSFRTKDAAFRAVGKSIVEQNVKNATRQLSYFFAPKLVKLFRIPFFDPGAAIFLRNVFWEAIELRKSGNCTRNDMIDILVQMMNDNNGVKFEGDTVVAQAAQFFAAGFEAIASTISFTIYELCLNSEIQDLLRSEIKAVLTNSEINYDAIQRMKYLHMAVCETLRKYPVLPFLDRMCIEDYTIPGTNIIIEKGTPVYVPTFGLHYDARYFPNPTLYDPERFSDLNKNKIPGFSYIPFGEGPRNCIGERFGLMAAKVAIIHILSNFIVEKAQDTPVPIIFDNRSVFLASTVGLPIKFTKEQLLVIG